MNAASLLHERTSRRVSPLFFVLALICFFFTFAGVSCNTVKARQAVSAAAGLGQEGGGGGVNTAQLNRCLDALQNVDLISYGGFTLAFGGAPAVYQGSVPACQTGALSQGTGSSASLPIGVQPLALIALLTIIGATLAGGSFLVVTVRPKLRLGLGMVLGAVAFFVLLFNQFHVHTAITAALDSVAAARGSPFAISDYFNLNDGLAWMLALVALAVGVLYQAVCFLAVPAVAPVPLTEPPP